MRRLHHESQLRLEIMVNGTQHSEQYSNKTFHSKIKIAGKQGSFVFGLIFLFAEIDMFEQDFCENLDDRSLCCKP